MTNKITKEFLFTELSIKIATLEMKVDKVLELLSKPEITVDDIKIAGAPPGHGAMWTGVMEFTPNPPIKRPNESHTDYLKRISQYNEAQSEDEQFSETYK